jgi:hypothetical protein
LPYNGQLLAIDPNQQLYGKSLKTFWIDAIDSPVGGGGAAGDPQISGLRGQSYQVHGIDGAVYNLITDHDIQLNGRFTFLDSGKCAIGQRKDCWSHPGSYISEIGLQYRVGDEVHKLQLVAGEFDVGFELVRLNDEHLIMYDGYGYSAQRFGEAINGSLSVTVKDSFTVIVHTKQWSFKFSSSDMFMNHLLWTRTPLTQLKSHGLIGQTWSTKTYNSQFKHMQGDVDDYLVSDEIWGTDFVFNLFNAANSGIVPSSD